MLLPAGYRPATPDDAELMAELVNMAGEGLPLYLWTSMAVPGESPWSVGQQRARRDAGAFSWRNTIVREEAGEIVGLLIGYPLDDEPEPTDYSSLPPMFVPLQQLEDMVPGTWYVNVLATQPHARGRGIGSGLLSLADDIAASTAKRSLSIIVADSNVGARKLYERHGYVEVARRPMVKDAWAHPGKDWVLLLKHAAGAVRSKE